MHLFWYSLCIHWMEIRRFAVGSHQICGSFWNRMASEAVWSNFRGFEYCDQRPRNSWCFWAQRDGDRKKWMGVYSKREMKGRSKMRLWCWFSNYLFCFWAPLAAGKWGWFVVLVIICFVCKPRWQSWSEIVICFSNYLFCLWASLAHGKWCWFVVLVIISESHWQNGSEVVICCFSKYL